MRADVQRGAWLRRRTGARAFALAVASAAFGLASVEALSGCGSDGGEGGTANEAGAQDGGATNALDATTEGGASVPLDGAATDSPAPVDGATGGTRCDPDASVDLDCTGRCGPLHDACTGATKMCGGCLAATTPDGGTEPRACDLDTNTCIKPKVTCADLNAECGTVRDTCGDYLDCPDTPTKGCAAGKECNPDTHACQDCEAVTCTDLGYECGFAWLGCGPDVPANATDCGSCAKASDGGAQTCNAVFHTCEPVCVPAPAATLCAAAKAKRGVECGFISNGCGGIVDCSTVTGFGCPTGQSCGVRGLANRCDPKETPAECAASGKTCGDITSSCTGQKVHCGDCAAGQVCNSNGVCGPVCAAKTCADFTQYGCGAFDDGCGGTVTCGTCPGGVCDQASHTCCTTKQCGSDYPGKCGTALPNGCGQNTDTCPCSVGATCTADGGAAPAPGAGATGSCCAARSAASYAASNQCGTNLPDGCGKTVNADCGGGKECVANATGAAGPAPGSGVVGSCCTRTDSCNLASGTCGAVQDSCRPAGSTYACNKCTTGTQCTANACCRPAPACAGGGGDGAECNDSKAPVDANCGSARTCACAGGRTCWCGDHACTAADGAGACKTPLTCGIAPYAGKCGTALDTGAGTAINCGCPSGQACSSTGPGAAALGTCKCNNPTGAAYTCSNVPGGPGKGGDACGTFDNGCGGTITCGCSGGLTCNTTPNPNVCCAAATCPAAALGSACGLVNNGCTQVSCGCPGGAGNENFQCTAGTCACVKDTCRGRTGPQPDKCGGTLECGG